MGLKVVIFTLGFFLKIFVVEIKKILYKFINYYIYKKLILIKIINKNI